VHERRMSENKGEKIKHRIREAVEKDSIHINSCFTWGTHLFLGREAVTWVTVPCELLFIGWLIWQLEIQTAFQALMIKHFLGSQPRGPLWWCAR
jgi:hypothetical protein